MRYHKCPHLLWLLPWGAATAHLLRTPGLFRLFPKTCYLLSTKLLMHKRQRHVALWDGLLMARRESPLG